MLCWGQIFLRVDILRVDILGVDILGIDILGVDIPEKHSSSSALLSAKKNNRLAYPSLASNAPPFDSELPSRGWGGREEGRGVAPFEDVAFSSKSAMAV